MLRHKNIDRICCIVLAATILLTCCFMGAAAAGLVAGEHTIGYENRLFDQSRVHTIDIVMDDWDAFLETCRNEVYSSCTVIIDGESYGNVGIRGKGNTSLSSVAQYGNDRYSFKIEFDQYQSGKTYHGLDKLSLNNLIQDKTCLKDYVAYTLMNKMGVAAPLCSFAQICVNGEAWGFYLVVEGVEGSFLQRNYGSEYGELYKPDSMSFGGGRGNGMEFNMDAIVEQFGMRTSSKKADEPADAVPSLPLQMPEGFDPTQMQRWGFDPSFMVNEATPGNFVPPATTDGTLPEGSDPADTEQPESFSRMDRFGMGGRGASDVMLQYVDDDPSSYSNILNNAKTDITESDQMRLIASLRILFEGEDIESVVDVESVIRYFVVHNFLCNDDSYTGHMIHNYYLYEEDGVLSMIPWDYNLAFGGFGMGGFGGSGATSTVNSPIDSLVSSGDIASRPMAAWIFDNTAYTDLYHEIYAEFMAEVFENGWFETELTRVTEMIDPYVQADENGFFSYEEFIAGSAVLRQFCVLRAQSVAGQLNGAIASTTETQRGADANLIDASHINLSDMGEFSMGGRGEWRATRGHSNTDTAGDADKTNSGSADAPSQMGSQIPGGFDPSVMQGWMSGNFDLSGTNSQRQGGKVLAGAVSAVSDMPEQSTGTAESVADEHELSEEAPASDDAFETAQRFWDRSRGASWDDRQTTGFSMGFAGMRAETQASSEIQWALLIGSTVLLILAIVFVIFFKSNL